MTLQVQPFPAELTSVVSGWARTDEEVLMWCGATTAPNGSSTPNTEAKAWAST